MKSLIIYRYLSQSNDIENQPVKKLEDRETKISYYFKEW